MKQKTIYYNDELNDEFSEAVIEPIKIDKNYKYINDSIFKKITHFFWYRIIANPLGFLYVKIAHKNKIINKSILKSYKSKPYFLYGNHTHHLADAIIPTLINGTKDSYTIVHPNNVSIPIIGKITPSLGAIPLPGDIISGKNFIECIKHHIDRNKSIVIYPEAHIWPYYTKIRPFKDTSFRYPVDLNIPVFTFTNTYQKRRFSSKPKIITYIDGPFFPDTSLLKNERRNDLRNKVYNAMVNRSQNSNVEYWKYIKKEG
ncbi:MAG: lysophospholipid acyltransferase family protein [Anaeroplasma sp.]